MVNYNLFFAPDNMKKSLISARYLCLIITASAAIASAQFVDTSRDNTAVMATGEWATQISSSSTGKEIISAGVDGRVAVWEAASGKVLRETTLPASVMSLSLSGDGRTLAAGDVAGTVSLIDVDTLKVRSTITADKKIVNATAWSPDGKFLAAGGNDGIVRVWSLGDNKITAEINPAHGNIVSLNFLNTQIAIGMVDLKQRSGNVEVWDPQTNKLVRVFDEGGPGLRATSASPDGKLLAVADYEPATLLSILPGEGNSFEASLRLLADTDDGTPVAVWDVTTGKRVGLFKAETGARGIAFSPDGKMLACSGINGVVIFDTGDRTFAEIGRVDSQTSIDAIAFSGDSQRLFLTRQREPLVRFGDGGLDKLFDPFVTAVVGSMREGTSSGVTVNTKEKSTRSLTGGSSIESWQVRRRSAPQDIQVWNAVRAFFDDKPDDAQKILQQVIKDFPKYGEAQRLNALLFSAQDLAKLQSLFESSIKADPSCTACLRSLGDLQYKLKQSAAAAANYDRVLKIKPEYGLVTGHLAEVYGQMALSLIEGGNTAKNMGLAADALNHALLLRPGVEQFYTNLGAVYYFRSDFDKDLSMLMIAQKLRPDHARIYYNLGHAYRYKGDKQKAIAAYQRYIWMGEKGEEARVERAKEFIKELSR